MKLLTVTRLFSPYAINIVFVVLSVLVETRCVLGTLRDVIESRKSLIDREVHRRLFATISRGNWVVIPTRTKTYKHLPDGVDPAADIHLVGHGREYMYLSLKDISYLDTAARYFFIDPEAISVYRLFLSHGLHSFMYTGRLNPNPAPYEIHQMSRIAEACLMAFDRLCGMEIVIEDLKVKLCEGSPGELHIAHPQAPSIVKSVFKSKDNLLENLKAHFTEFMGSVPLGVATSSFCSMYTKSAVEHLVEIGILRSAPSIKKYPEAIHCLFPFRIVDEASPILTEDLIVAGVALDRALQDCYLRGLFNVQKIEEITKNGNRFIFTSHVSINSQEGRYSVRFI